MTELREETEESTGTPLSQEWTDPAGRSSGRHSWTQQHRRGTEFMGVRGLFHSLWRNTHSSQTQMRYAPICHILGRGQL